MTSNQLDPKTKAEAYKETLRNALKADLYLLCHYLGYDQVTWSTHGEIITCLESDSKRKILVVPRDCFKSTIGVVCFTIWRLIRDPNDTILIDSELFTNSSTFLREIKGHLESDKMTSLFGKFKSSTWNDTEIIIKQRTKYSKEASVTCGGVGTVKVGQHYKCLAPETKILTSNGFVQIKDVRPKMRVYSSDGKFHSIKHVVKKASSKSMIGIRAHYQTETNWVTEDHKMLVYRDDRPQWIEAGQINLDDRLCVPKVKGYTRQLSKVDKYLNSIIAKPDIWRLIGYWLAEGCITKDGNQIRLCFAHDEDEYLNDVKSIVETYLNVPCSIGNRTKSNTRMICFSHKEMKEILLKFGSGSRNLHMPPFALNADYNKQIEMIKGYWRGDGTYSESSKVVSFGSISHDLLSGLQIILATMNIQSGIAQGHSEGWTRIVGKLAYGKDSYALTSSSPLLKLMLGLPVEFSMNQPAWSFFTDKYWVTHIHRLERKDNFGAVYDIEVADVHDFYLPGMIAHNCIVGDDYNSQNNSNTKEKCEKIINHFRYNLSILSTQGTYVLIGTRYSENDLIGWVLRELVKDKDLSEGKI